MSSPLGTLREQWHLVNGQPMFSRISIDPTPPGAPPFVLVHGFAISGRSLVPTALRLAPHYPTYVADLPGFGRSVKPDHAPTIPELADALAAWMEAVGLARAVLLGNSMGCQVIAELAYRHPGRVERAVFVGPTGDPKARGPLKQLRQLIRDGLQEPLPLVRIAVLDYLGFGLWRALGLLRAMNGHPMVERLRQLAVPTLLVVGSLDPVLPEERAAKLLRLLRHGRLVVVPGVGHAVTFAAPDQLIGEIRAFMAEPWNPSPAGEPDGAGVVIAGRIVDGT